MESLAIKKAMANSYNNIGIISADQGNYNKALENHFASLKIKEEIGYKKGIADSYNNIGIIYWNQGNYDQALENYFASLKIREKTGDKKGIALSYNNIGLIYWNQGNYDQALKNYFASLKIREEIGDKKGFADSYNNIGIIYSAQGKSDKALENYFASLKIREEIGDKQGMAFSYGNIGIIYDNQRNYEKALENYFKALKMDEELGNKRGVARHLNNIGNSYLKQNKITEAKKQSLMSLSIAKEIGSKDQMKYTYYSLSQCDSTAGDWKGAYEYHQLYSAVKDSIFNEESNEQITEMSTKYETEKKEQQIKLIKTEQEKQTAVAEAESKKQKIIIWSVVSGLLLVLVLAVFIFRSLRSSQKQKHIIEEQKLLVEEKHKEISDSINYAERIQRALLASTKMLDENLNDYFILFKPKDIVSGDFYWATKLSNNNFALVTADSTGHGVPGAIMSILNIACLDKAVTKGITSPELILNETRKLVIENLKNDGSEEGGKDGMDGNLISFDFENKTMQCASANNPIWIIRKGKLIEIKSDRMPIGKHDKDKIPFSLQTINLQSGDLIYTLTDGFADQFGGHSGKKFKYKRLQELLLCIADDSLTVQQEKLNAALENWKGNLEQVDDVCIVGIRV
ncbi:MAG: tetratricopeptide repeat protein [Bacteroidota bacterium]